MFGCEIGTDVWVCKQGLMFGCEIGTDVLVCKQGPMFGSVNRD